jgi:hypothetical protein
MKIGEGPRVPQVVEPAKEVTPASAPPVRVEGQGIGRAPVREAPAGPRAGTGAGVRQASLHPAGGGTEGLEEASRSTRYLEGLAARAGDLSGPEMAAAWQGIEIPSDAASRFLWSDAGAALRSRSRAALGAIADAHGDVFVPGRLYSDHERSLPPEAQAEIIANRTQTIGAMAEVFELTELLLTRDADAVQAKARGILERHGDGVAGLRAYLEGLADGTSRTFRDLAGSG